MKDQRILWTVLGLTFVGFVTAAGDLAAQDRTGQEGDGEAVVDESRIPVTLTVVNNNWADMRIYAVRLGTRFRLGTVTSFQRESFRLPDHLQPDITEVQLLAVPIGGAQAVLSPVVFPSGGDEVVWGLQNNLALSGTIVG